MQFISCLRTGKTSLRDNRVLLLVMAKNAINLPLQALTSFEPNKNDNCLKSKRRDFYSYGLLTLLNTSFKLFLECKGFWGIQLTQQLVHYSKWHTPDLQRTGTPCNPRSHTSEPWGISWSPTYTPETEIIFQNPRTHLSISEYTREL